MAPKIKKRPQKPKYDMQMLDQLPKSINGILEPVILIENTKYARWLSDLRLKPQRKNVFIKLF